MKKTEATAPHVVWIRGPRLRARWDMSNSTFYRKLKDGAIPKPSFPFGDKTPYWSVAEVEAFEQRAQKAAPK